MNIIKAYKVEITGACPKVTSQKKSTQHTNNGQEENLNQLRGKIVLDSTSITCLRKKSCSVSRVPWGK